MLSAALGVLAVVGIQWLVAAYRRGALVADCRLARATLINQQ
ncbi:MAG: hypothetical protein V7K27_12365 [Nostoc sp.]